MVYRIYVEKKPGFDGEAQGLCHELVDLLGIKALKGLRLINRYDVEGIDNVLFQQAMPYCLQRAAGRHHLHHPARGPARFCC